MRPATFSRRLLAWHARHGRTDLPWQRAVTPYRVWVSEIMLQQTQVSTVIPYFERFVTRFPDVAALAAAPIDAVLHLWTGLGYYARARHLHAAAQRIRDTHGGRLPRTPEALMALPGIGRSTAGAILALAHGQRQPILDGNAKRVLARFHAVAGWPGRPAVEQALWRLAEAHTPTAGVAAYTQAIMDLGATLCTRAAPACDRCPVSDGCAALAAGEPTAYPAPRPRPRLPVRATTMLIVRNPRGEVLLEQRPPSGVWGGLWGFPECPPEADPRAWCRTRLGWPVGIEARWETLRHTFSHFHLDITPVLARTRGTPAGVMEAPRSLWYNLQAPDALGFAAPVKRLLARLGHPDPQP